MKTTSSTWFNPIGKITEKLSRSLWRCQNKTRRIPPCLPSPVPHILCGMTDSPQSSASKKGSGYLLKDLNEHAVGHNKQGNPDESFVSDDLNDNPRKVQPRMASQVFYSEADAMAENKKDSDYLINQRKNAVAGYMPPTEATLNALLRYRRIPIAKKATPSVLDVIIECQRVVAAPAKRDKNEQPENGYIYELRAMNLSAICKEKKLSKGVLIQQIHEELLRRFNFVLTRLPDFAMQVARKCPEPASADPAPEPSDAPVAEGIYEQCEAEAEKKLTPEEAQAKYYEECIRTSRNNQNVSIPKLLESINDLVTVLDNVPAVYLAPVFTLPDLSTTWNSFLLAGRDRGEDVTFSSTGLPIVYRPLRNLSNPRWPQVLRFSDWIDKLSEIARLRDKNFELLTRTGGRTGEFTKFVNQFFKSDKVLCYRPIVERKSGSSKRSNKGHRGSTTPDTSESSESRKCLPDITSVDDAMYAEQIVKLSLLIRTKLPPKLVRSAAKTWGGCPLSPERHERLSKAVALPNVKEVHDALVAAYDFHPPIEKGKGASPSSTAARKRDPKLWREMDRLIKTLELAADVLEQRGVAEKQREAEKAKEQQKVVEKAKAEKAKAVSKTATTQTTTTSGNKTPASKESPRKADDKKQKKSPRKTELPKTKT